MSRKKTTRAKAASDSFCVYIGPTIYGVIQEATIFREDRKTVLKNLASVIEERPKIATLIVSGESLAEARIKVKTPGNLLYVNYHKLASGK
ncbi:MAG: hypothetical protein LUD25_02470 [Coriobacteriaceae bacterium]|nr:hypothetical protein [Coriobacteriaceae bacterium]